jgi:hypothetical protein
MSWEQALLDLFDDLETRAEGLAQEARDDDVADLARTQYAEVDLAARLHGAVGRTVALEATGAIRLRGRLQRVGRGCAAVMAQDGQPRLHLVNLTHVLTVTTTSTRASASELLPITSRLGLGSAVRHLVDEVDVVALGLCDGRRLVGEVVRVEADFLEVAAEAVRSGAGTTMVPLSAVVTVAPA